MQLQNIWTFTVRHYFIHSYICFHLMQYVQYVTYKNALFAFLAAMVIDDSLLCYSRECLWLVILSIMRG